MYPYLLGGMEITQPNQVWAADITYIPMARGFLYLVAIMDWYSQHVMAWRLSNTLDADFCVEALEEALGKGRPEVSHTDHKGASSPARPSPDSWSAMGSASAWTARGAILTTSLWSGCGGASSTRRCT